MTLDIEVAEGDVERLSLREYTEKAYLDYSMYESDLRDSSDTGATLFW